ncbi:enoyl-CoA hydratase [Sphingobium lactosutens]|uniref:enoyl-CoA hydratase n=1 Tax=Sphingobium lactosutens TaxID=522773 RepID=UPI0035685688
MATYETDEPILYERRDATAWIMLNRPDFANSQNGQMLYALDAAFARAVDDPQVRAIVLTGKGKHFSSGHDIGTPGRDADLPAAARHSLWGDHSELDGAASTYVREQELYLGLCRRWRDIPKPTIAAVHGACIAGGLMLAWVCDLIIASRDAFFSDPVLRMGIPGVEYFAHAFEMHPRAAREFLFLGDRMPAERAYALGMVNRVVERDALEAEAGAIAERLAALPAFGLTLAKQALNQAEDAMGKRVATDAAFNLHHLAHAHARMTTGSAIGGQDARSMAAGGKEHPLPNERSTEAKG